MNPPMEIQRPGPNTQGDERHTSGSELYLMNTEALSEPQHSNTFAELSCEPCGCSELETDTSLEI